MLNKKNNKPINIGILEISAQNKAILEFFFNSAGKTLFKEVNQASASAFIIDYDFPGAKESWQDHFNKTKKPGILMSVHEIDIPSAIWIVKPLTTSALVKAGEKIQAMIADANAGLAEQNKTVALEETHSNTASIIINPQEIGLIEESTPALEESLEKVVEVEVNSVKETVTADTSLDAPLSNPKKTSNLQHGRSGSNEISNEHIAEVEDLLQSLMAGAKSKPAEQELNVTNTQLKEEFFEEKNIDLDTVEFDLVEDSEQATSEKETTKIKTEEILDSLDENIQDFSLLKEISQEKDTQAQPSEDEFNLIDSQSLEVLETATDEISIDMVNIEEKPNSDSNQEIDKLINIDTLSNTVEREDIEPHITTVGKEQTTSEIELLIEDGDSANQYLIENEKTSAGLEDHREITLEDSPLDEEKTRAEEAAKISAESLAKIDSFSNQEATVVIDKDAPLSAEEELQRLLDEIREEAENSKLIEREGESLGLSTKSVTNDTEERWDLICGKNDDIKSEKGLNKIAFNDKNYISAIFRHVLEKIEQSHKVMRIKLGKTIIVVDTEHDNVYCNDSIFGADFADICFEAIDKNDIKIHNLDKSEVRMYLRKAETRPENIYSIEAFIWTTSLLSSRGRLPKGTDVNLKIGLKHWPNITRLETFPHIIQIAAVFKKHPGSLLDIAKWLEIPQSSVFAFYNGALALNLIEFDQEKLVSSTTLESSSEKKKENRGFFSRLLKRITR